MKKDLIITIQIVYILLSLTNNEKHGYDIMKDVRKFSDGKMSMGPGTLYGALKRMLDAGLISETESTISESSDERRRYYNITEKGKSILSSEIKKMQETVDLAKSLKVNLNV